MLARLRELHVVERNRRGERIDMKVKIRGKKVSIKLDPSNADDQAFGNEYMRMMSEAYRSEPSAPTPATSAPKPPRKRSKRAR